MCLMSMQKSIVELVQQWETSWQSQLQQICRRSLLHWTACLVALVVVVVVIVIVVTVTVPLPGEAACAMHIGNSPWELHTASDLQVVCTAAQIQQGVQPNMS